MDRGEMLEPWVGKAVQLLIRGDADPHVALLEGYDDRGVMLRYTERDVRVAQDRGEDHPREPMLVFFPWRGIIYVAAALEDVEKPA